MPGFTFPSVGPLGLGSPPFRSSSLFDLRYYDPLRLPLLLLGSLRFPLVCRYLAIFPLGSCPFRFAYGGGRIPASAWLFLYSGLPVPVFSARRWRFSRVPRLPLCVHAPLVDSGGVLSTRHSVFRTHAFRLSQTVSFPQLAPGYPLGPQL